MPVYDLKCKKCGHVEETICKSSNPPYPLCPKCKNDTEREFNPRRCTLYYKRKDAYYGE